MGNAIRHAIHYLTMYIQKGWIAPAIWQVNFAKSNSWIANWEIFLSFGLLVHTKSWFLGSIEQ